MANFNPPLGETADKRYPTSDERAGGFLCGPADILLFRGLFHRIESELGAIITQAGLTQTDGDFTQVLQAIQLLIDAATGGGDPSGYLTMLQARARLPIFPDVQNTDGRIIVTAPSTGVVRLPGGVTFQHRGIFPVSTVQTDFATDPSKIYHLRWDPTDGFTLKDSADPVYNPGGLVETNKAFDSTFDSMLIARVITSSANVAQITNLANKDRLRNSQTVGLQFPLTPVNASTAPFQFSLNWARTPMSWFTWDYKSFAQKAGNDQDERVTVTSQSRYGASGTVMLDYGDISPSSQVFRMTSVDA